MLTHIFNLETEAMDTLVNHASFKQIMHFMLPNLIDIDNWFDFVAKESVELAEWEDISLDQAEIEVYEMYEISDFYIGNTTNVLIFKA